MTAKQLHLMLTSICEEISKGDYEKAKAIFDLPPCNDQNDPVAILIEAFSMMLLRIEAREFEMSGLLEKLKKAKTELLQHKENLSQENTRLKKELIQKNIEEKPLGQTKSIQTILKQIERISPMDSNLLITGETGTGKGKFAKYIHELSPRSPKPFIIINCAAIPATLLESELFGIEAGVASGVQARMGRFEQASGGTIFLDEIGDMPFESQAKLLHIIETGLVERVGGRKQIKVDVRIIAATLHDLEQMVKNKTFREDLYYRLNVIHLHIPPLRERRDDILLLTKHILAKQSLRNPLAITAIHNEALEVLTNQRWQGNVRELENVLERAALMAEGSQITAAEIINILGNNYIPDSYLFQNKDQSTLNPAYSNANIMPNIDFDPSNQHGLPTLQQLENKYISILMEHFNHNKSKTAKTLDISREGLRIKLDKLAKNPNSLI